MLFRSSLLAGAAFSNSMVGLVHAIGHALGGVCRVAHGDAMTILLPAVMEFNLPVCGTRYGELLLALAGPEEYAATPAPDRAAAAIGTVDALRRRDVSGRAVEKHFIHMALSNLVRYRYDNVELLFRGAADFLEGPEFLLSTDPEALHKTLMAAGDKFRPLSEMDVAFDERKYLANYERVNTPFSRDPRRGRQGGGAGPQGAAAQRYRHHGRHGERHPGACRHLRQHQHAAAPAGHRP